MKVVCHYRNDPERSLTDPLPEKNGFVFRLLSGDICSPMFREFRKEHWFVPTYPTWVWRAFCKLPILPFIAWRIGNKGGYIGFKTYGVDSDAYKLWTHGIKPEDVYDGSYALTLSCRPFATIES